MKRIYVLLISVLLFQCQEKELIVPLSSMEDALDVTSDVTAKNNTSARTASYTYYVSTTGNNTNDGSSARPWKSLRYAVSKTPANQNYAIQLAAGTYIEDGLIEVPLGVSVYGAGIDQTILKAASSFYYYPASPAYATEKFLISLNEYNQLNGNQTLSGFTIDGDGKKLHGGIYVRHRNDVIIDNVKVQNVNFTGIWLWDLKDSQLKNTQIINSSWGSASYCVGALNIGHLERVEISNLNINENKGYGIKAIGPSGNNNLWSLKIRDSRISVAPYGLWNNGSAPNIAIELWQVNLIGCEISDSYVDNTISLVNSNASPSTGVQTIRVHHNMIDMETRAQGAGYGVELTIHDAEVDHNYFLKGTYGIANWDNPFKNWNIHHNTFYGLQNFYPGEVVRSQWSGLHNVKFYNNTVEFTGTKTMNVVGLYGGTSDNLDIKNNLFIDNNTGYSYYPNELVHLQNGATVSVLTVKNNSFTKLPVGSVAGTYSGNITSDPLLTKTGNRPDPYYMPKSGSPLINAGLNVGYAFTGTAPDIGALETGGTATGNAIPQVSITSPANNASFTTGSSVTISTNATDSDGTIAKVEFYNGATLLGQDLISPYSFAWANVAAGNYSLTAKATDNLGGVTTSGIVTISVGSTNAAPAVAITAPLNNAKYTPGSSINITANATDNNGTITKVEFYNGSTLLGQDVTSPYSFAWANVPSGNYSLKAKATDNQGAATTSAIVTILVSTTTNQVPVVSLTNPVNNSAFVAGASVTLTATASDGDGSVAKVEFFNGTTKLGEDLTSPYSLVWSANAGIISARAIDNVGATSTSNSATVTITTTSTTSVKLILDSNAATLSGKMTKVSDAQAVGGSYFYVAPGNGANYYIPPPASASFNFNLTKTDNYVIWARVKTPAASNQSAFVYNGKGKWITWNAGIRTDWTWVKITDGSSAALFPFVQGANGFQIAWNHENVKVDQVMVTNDLTFIPQ